MTCISPLQFAFGERELGLANPEQVPRILVLDLQSRKILCQCSPLNSAFGERKLGLDSSAQASQDSRVGHGERTDSVPVYSF